MTAPGMVFLGFGKYARADRIYALQPITGRDRGNGRRTLEDVIARSALGAAPALLGWTLLRDGVGGEIVELEAYGPDDPASHSYRGATDRNRSMFGPAGHLYVYRSYGIHWCANIVCGQRGEGAAVLLRALRPTAGIDAMRSRRRLDDVRQLCSGPGKLTQALGITGADDGSRVDRDPFVLLPPPEAVAFEATPRIGIARAADVAWRYVVSGTPWASRPPPRAAP